MRTLNIVIAGFLIEAGMAMPCWAGPASDYYVTSGSNVYHIKGDLVLNTWTTVQFNEYPIVVMDTVRTGSYQSTVSGHEYSLAGSLMGATYAPTISGLHHDGATDGTGNFTTSYWSNEIGTLGTAVWRTDADWMNPVKLFDTLAHRPSGIAYDPSNQSLWISEWQEGAPVVRNYSMDGALLSSFSTSGRYSTSLALDPKDGTLWMGSYNDLGYYYQYSRAGGLLSTSYYAELAGVRTLGGEIAPVPEPASYALLLAGIGLLALRFERGNRQHTA